MIDTVEAGAGSYPEPPEIKENHINGKVMLTFDIDADVPSNWTLEDVEDDLKRNLRDYVGLYDFEEIEVNIVM
ncbi:MAG: hypothetical protein NC483_00675 [Ruminococcus sp.]|nr:hypothetical protein [Ruminococcus sp.]